MELPMAQQSARLQEGKSYVRSDLGAKAGKQSSFLHHEQLQ
jgi:hypothetical protein